MYTHANLMQAVCTSTTLQKNEKISNQTLAETTSIENQNLLKTQKLTLSEKKNNPRKIS
jgi:hypothetical protein